MENNKNYSQFKELYSDFKNIVLEMDKQTKEDKKTFRTFKVRWADQSVNRNNRALIIEGINIDDYLKNPVIFINHESYDVLKIVWRATKVFKDTKNKEIIFEGQFADTELGNMIADLYDDGFLKTVSLGYNVTERDDTDPRICTKVDLFECSFVAIPANTNSEKLDSIKQDKMDKLVELGIVKLESEDNLAEEGKEEEEIKEEVEVKEDKLNISEINAKLDTLIALLSKDNKEEEEEDVSKNDEKEEEIEKKVEKNEKNDILTSEEDLMDLFIMSLNKISLKK